MLVFVIVVVENVLFLRRVAFGLLFSAMIAAGWGDSGGLRVLHSGAKGDFKLFIQLGVLQEDVVVSRITLVLNFFLRSQA